MNIKTFLVVCFWSLAFVASQLGCSENAVNPDELASSNLQISDIKNFVWTLEAVRQAGRQVDLSAYPPFRLIYGDEGFYGDDGCNHFGGRYETRNDSIFPHDISQTERLCDVASFSVLHLATPYRIQIGSNELRIFTGNDFYSYKSDVTASLAQSPVVRNWQLQSSSDPEFGVIESQLLIPVLLLDESRTFKIAWKCFPNNLFGCNEISGVFGIGESNKIRFYQTGSQLDGPNGFGFVQRVLNSSLYGVKTDSVKGGTLRLVNTVTATTYDFIAIQR